MTYKARAKKKNVDEDFDHLFIPKRGLAICSPSIGSCRRSPRIKTLSAIYELDDSSTSSQLESNSGDNSSCNSYPIKLEGIEEVDDPFSSNTLDDTREQYMNKKRKALNSATQDHSPVRQKEDASDLDVPLISLKLNKGKKRRKLFKYTETSSIDKAWISNDPTSQKSNSVTDENVEAVLDNNILDSGIFVSTDSLSSEIVETCDNVNCNMGVNHLTDISTSVSEVKSNVTVIKSVESNSPHNVFASDEYIDPSVENYNSSHKINLTFEGVIDNRDDTTILIQPHDSCVAVGPMESDSQACIVQSNEEHFENGRSIDMSVPPYSESNTWPSSTSDWHLDINKGSYDDIVYDNHKNCVNEFSSINNCTEFRMGNQGEKAVVQETCNFGEASVYKDVGSLDSLVFQALCGDAHINNQESQVQLTVENNKSVEAYDSSHPKHSDTFSSPSDLHSISISPLENSGSFSAKMQTLNNVVERISDAVNNIHSSTEIKFSLVEGQELNNENESERNQGANDEDKNYPKNLSQNRKDLPPKSQEKLCWYDNELDDTIKVFGHMADSIQSPEITRRRLKRNKKLPHLPSSKEILKPKDGPDGNYMSIQATTNIQSQKAVLFSQRQMQDIENIAGKLLKEMSFLKSIVTDIMNNDNVSSEACLLSTSKFTPEAISAAVGNASTLEVTTKKWLAMMSKDCTRFCKIMSSTEGNVSSPAAAAAASKQSRKVTFADEAGGSLCHVKVFEQPPAADIQVEPENGNQNESASSSAQ